MPIYALLSNTTYAVYVELANNAACASDLRFMTTTGTNVCGAPPTGIAVNVNCQTATITWNASGYTNFVISYVRLSPGINSTTNGTTATSLVINSTYPTQSSTYEISVRGKCANGSFTALCAPVIFTIPPIGVNTVQNVAIVNYTCNKFTASWTPEPTAINGYQVYVQRTGGSTNSYNIASSTVTFTGLVSGATYSIWVKGKGCNSILGNTSNVASQVLPVVCATARTSSILSADEINVIENEGSNPVLMNLYPNPTDGKFTLELSKEQSNEEAHIQVLNMLGQVVYERHTHYEQGVLKERIELRDASSGNYFVKVITGVEVNMVKITVQKE